MNDVCLIYSNELYEKWLFQHRKKNLRPQAVFMPCAYVVYTLQNICLCGDVCTVRLGECEVCRAAVV